MSGWKQFNFFDQSAIPKSEDALPCSILFQQIQTTCSTAGIFFGDSDGNVHLIDKDLNCILSFKAYPGKVGHLIYIASRKILLSIGDEDMGMPTFKVWQFKEETGTAPVLVRTTKIMHGNKVFPVTAFASLENLTQVAVGLENGVVILIKGDVSKDRHTKSKIVYEGSELITCLGFRDDGIDILLYIVTLAKVLIHNTAGKDCIELDTITSTIGTTILSPQDKNQDVVIATDDAVYFYGPEGKGPCFIIGGQKRFMTWVNGYLAVVSCEPSIVPTKPILGSGPVPQEEDVCLGTLLTIYDLKAKLIAFKDDFGKRIFNSRAAKAIGEPIKHLLFSWGQLHVFTTKNSIFRLKEMDMHHKLEQLFDKHQYNLAMSVVLQPSSSTADVGKPKNLQTIIDDVVSNPNHLNWTRILDVAKRFGDYLYTKSDFDAAMKQYIKTIGNLEPSYVIRKFLDAQRINHLTLYLEALHEKQLANGDHTTLLLNCYTKLNDLIHLNEFIDVSDSFDPETAIMVCRNSGYHQQALRIASKFEQHDWYIKLLVEDLNQIDSAISYMSDLPFDLFEKVLANYGSILVSKNPRKMTAILLEHHSKLDVNDLITFYVSQPGWCVMFLRGVLQNQFGISLDEESEIVPVVEETPDLKNICDTLLDLELSLYSSNESLPGLDMDEESWTVRLLHFLKSSQVKFDLENALFLCKSNHFKLGELVICERLGLYHDCFEIYIETNDFDKMLQLCEKFGNKEPLLWNRLFDYTIETCKVSESPDQRLLQVLDLLEHCQLFSETEIVQMLSQNDKITLGMVRPYLLRVVAEDTKYLKRTQALIENYKEETELNKASILAIEQKEITFQSNKCELCRQMLELPTINFLCKHSYHAKCLGDMSHECPRCGPEHHLIEEMIRSQRERSNQEDFVQKLDNAKSKSFEVMMEYLSNNML